MFILGAYSPLADSAVPSFVLLDINDNTVTPYVYTAAKDGTKDYNALEPFVKE